MPEMIAQTLLMHVLYEVSAVVSIAADGSVVCIKLFDTVFGGEYMCVDAAAKEVWLMSNHPEGRTELYKADRTNLRWIQAAVPTARVRLFITNEDFGCMEMDLPADGMAHA